MKIEDIPDFIQVPVFPCPEQDCEEFTYYGINYFCPEHRTKRAEQSTRLLMSNRICDYPGCIHRVVENAFYTSRKPQKYCYIHALPFLFATKEVHLSPYSEVREVANYFTYLRNLK